MSPIPPHRRLCVNRVFSVGSALTAFISVALLAGTLAPAAAQPVKSALSVTADLVATQTVTIGAGTYTLSGTDIARADDALVVYRSPVTRTPTNRWGVEVTVVNGKVTASNDRQLSGSTVGTAVPADGYVLSGHNLAADWLRGYAKVGAAVSLSGDPTTPVPTPLVTPEAGQLVAVGGGQYNLAGVNIARAVDALVVYRSPVTVTTTNSWGAEVSVLNGKVTAVNDRQASASTTGTAVPAGGYILSGHGQARDWLRTYAKVGSTVTATNPTTPVPTPPPAPVGTSAPMGLPAKVEAIYHMMWSASGSPLLRDIPSQTNVVNLAFMQGDAPTLVGWGSQSEASFIEDARLLRSRGVRIVASVGGAGGRVNVGNREAFVQGVMNLNAKLPLDGLDWDIEGGTSMPASDVVWISKRLKELRGSNFAITLAPNGSNIDAYRAIAVQLQANNALDMIGQQFYDAVVSKEAAKWRVGQLVDAGIPQAKIAIGMMVGNADTYWTVDECIAAVQFIKASYAGIRGGYLWEHGRAGTADWANRLAPVLKG